MVLGRGDKYWHALRCMASGECEKCTSGADRQTCNLSAHVAWFHAADLNLKAANGTVPAKRLRDPSWSG